MASAAIKLFETAIGFISDGSYEATIGYLCKISVEQLEQLDFTELVNSDMRSNKETVNWLLDIESGLSNELKEALFNAYAYRFNLKEKLQLMERTRFSDAELGTLMHKTRDGLSKVASKLGDFINPFQPSEVDALSNYETHEFNPHTNSPQLEIDDTMHGLDKPLFISNPPLLKGTAESAGHDLPSDEDVVIPAHKSITVDSGVRISIPSGYHVEVKARSGLRFRYGVTAFNGVIDSDYSGTIKVCMQNDSDEDYLVRKGDRIGQLVIYKDYSFSNCIVPTRVDDVTPIHAGFGSTGV